MLSMIFGRAGYGKTHFTREMLCSYAKEGRNGLCLIVPDQYSFESERAILRMLGASDVRNVEVLGFSRLCDVVFKLYGGFKKPEIDSGSKAVFMRLAIDACEDSLVLYKKSVKNEGFLQKLLDMSEELKASRVSNEMIAEASQKFTNCALQSKLGEISTVLSAYDALVGKDHFDPAEKLELLYDKIDSNGYFKGKTVVFDSFYFFSEQQKRIVELAIKQADECIITFSSASLDDNTPMFSEIKKTAFRFITFANKNDVAVREQTLLKDSKRFATEELKTLEKYVFSPYVEKYKGEVKNVSVCRCDTKYEEADYIARTVQNLVLNEGYRYRDFAVIGRTDDSCKNSVDFAFEKYGIPFFSDRREPLKYQPLIRLVIYAVKSAFNLSNANIFSYLKTGIAGINDDDIAKLENYAITWAPTEAEWKSEFTLNPDGYVEIFKEEQKQLLSEIEDIRKRTVGPILALRHELFSCESGTEISKTIYSFLKNNNIDKNLAKHAENDEALRDYSSVWDNLMKLFDKFSRVLEDTFVTPRKYLELFELMVSKYTVGNIPQHIDEVSIGNAERMRPASPKVVFIVGANDKIFPRVSTDRGLLTSLDRSELIKYGLDINDCAERELTDELSLCYNALCAPSEKLYVCYHSSDVDGTVLYPSRMVTDIVRIFPEIKVIDEKAYADKTDEECLEPVVSYDTSLELVAKHYREHSVFSDSLLEALKNNDDTRTLAENMISFAKLEKETVSKETAEKLFGGNKVLSPSSIESYFRCPFRYFCHYGLNVKAPSVAEMNSQNRGTLIHYCLENLIEENGSEKLKTMTSEEISNEIDKLLKRYLDNVLGGASNKTGRFMHNYNMVRELVSNIAVMMAKEFKAGRFVTAACELEIGTGMSSRVAPLKIITPDGSTISVKGFIDRTDVCKEGNKTFIRVIDYKTGDVKLTATDIYNGLHLQMPLYLFTLVKNGETLGENRIPAAVLYLHAKDTMISGTKDMNDSEISDELDKKFRLSGLYLDDKEVFDALDTEREGKYLSLNFKKDGSASGRVDGVVDINVMQKIENRIEVLLSQMMSELKKGNVSADPTDTDESKQDGCKYCDYYAVCRVDNKTEHKTAVPYKYSDFAKEVNDGE